MTCLSQKLGTECSEEICICVYFCNSILFAVARSVRLYLSTANCVESAEPFGSWVLHPAPRQLHFPPRLSLPHPCHSPQSCPHLPTLDPGLASGLASLLPGGFCILSIAAGMSFLKFAPSPGLGLPCLPTVLEPKLTFLLPFHWSRAVLAWGKHGNRQRAELGTILSSLVGEACKWGC